MWAIFLPPPGFEPAPRPPDRRVCGTEGYVNSDLTPDQIIREGQDVWDGGVECFGSGG